MEKIRTIETRTIQIVRDLSVQETSYTTSSLDPKKKHFEYSLETILVSDFPGLGKCPFGAKKNLILLEHRSDLPPHYNRSTVTL